MGFYNGALCLGIKFYQSLLIKNGQSTEYKLCEN